jgi:hypothetical protein
MEVGTQYSLRAKTPEELELYIQNNFDRNFVLPPYNRFDYVQKWLKHNPYGIRSLQVDEQTETLFPSAVPPLASDLWARFRQLLTSPTVRSVANPNNRGGVNTQLILEETPMVPLVEPPSLSGALKPILDALPELPPFPLTPPALPAVTAVPVPAPPISVPTQAPMSVPTALMPMYQGPYPNQTQYQTPQFTFPRPSLVTAPISVQQPVPAPAQPPVPWPMPMRPMQPMQPMQPMPAQIPTQMTRQPQISSMASTATTTTTTLNPISAILKPIGEMVKETVQDVQTVTSVLLDTAVKGIQEPVKAIAPLLPTLPVAPNPLNPGNPTQLTMVPIPWPSLNPFNTINSFVNASRDMTNSVDHGRKYEMYSPNNNMQLQPGQPVNFQVVPADFTQFAAMQGMTSSSISSSSRPRHRHTKSRKSKKKKSSSKINKIVL